eukprot:TRINITY_DN66611_c9_g7_i1.p1 TRINITY_DN66611_c9_g7~~TRINITY_DN66611_c9_g7_i1.p1  ORF type:complete len:311 (+),score=39.92 TRINITY_DN66611_c9_g7_i1:44-976(+)
MATTQGGMDGIDGMDQDVKSMLVHLSAQLNVVVQHIAGLESSVRRLERRQEMLLDQTRTVSSEVREVSQEIKEKGGALTVKNGCGEVTEEDHYDHGEHHHHHHRMHIHHFHDHHTVATAEEILDLRHSPVVETNVIPAEDPEARAELTQKKLRPDRVGEWALSEGGTRYGLSLAYREGAQTPTSENSSSGPTPLPTLPAPATTPNGTPAAGGSPPGGPGGLMALGAPHREREGSGVGVAGPTNTGLSMKKHHRDQRSCSPLPATSSQRLGSPHRATSPLGLPPHRKPALSSLGGSTELSSTTSPISSKKT